jgi:subtilisin family serine protease
MILPLKISSGTSDVFEAASVAEAIIYAADYGTKIINLSLGWSDEEPQVITDAISYAVNKGTLLIAAAGNVYGDPVYFPASHEDVVAVSATNQNDENVSSAFGPELDLVAPGSLMVTTARGGLYISVSGTSLSAPLVSAVAGLVSAVNTQLSDQQVKEYLIQTSDDLGDEGRDDIYGYGKVNAFKAVTKAIWCEGDFDCDTDVDGTDAATFKADFGRSTYQNPCTTEHPCNGDFDCDSDCDGLDAAFFKSDFGRSAYNNLCPACEQGNWCNY